MTRAPDGVTIEPAAPGDLPAVLALLTAASLPREGVADHFPRFLVARRAGDVVGSIGLEPYGRSALLRSLAVAPQERDRGLGRELTERLLELAAGDGATRIFLLTETAADFFVRLGFRPIAREDVDPAVRASLEFAGICPQSAVCMRRDL
jgi:amino-acid N-acetyltransferase